MTDLIMKHKPLFLPLILSVFFFGRKGLQYAFIGSYLPIGVIGGVSILLIWSLNKRKKSFLLTAKIWAILLLVWSAIRICFSVIQLSVKPLSNYHIAQQFGYAGLLFSLLMLLAGILILRDARSKQVKHDFKVI